MNLHVDTTGFVFKKEDILEADRNFSIFTRDLGRVEVLAKAIRKISSKLRYGIEIFCVSEIEFVQGRTKKTLTDTVFKEKFKEVTRVPEKLKVAYGIANVIDRFIKGEEKDERIFDLLVDVFRKLDRLESPRGYKLAYYYFLWNFFSLQGYKPELSRCAACGGMLNPYNLYFSNREGGIICKGCFAKKDGAQKVSSDVVKLLRLIFKKDWAILSRLKVQENSQKLLEKVSENYYQHLLHVSGLSANSYV